MRSDAAVPEVDDSTSSRLADALDAIVAGRPVPHPTTQAVGCFIADLTR
jgi:hypothetical protein